MASLRLLVLTAALYACGGAGGTSVTVEQAWARTSAAGQTTGAVYFELTVPNDDLLIGVAVSPSVASDAQIHSSMTIGDGSTMMHEASSLPMVADEPVLFSVDQFSSRDLVAKQSNAVREIKAMRRASVR